MDDGRDDAQDDEGDQECDQSANGNAPPEVEAGVMMAEMDAGRQRFDLIPPAHPQRVEIFEDVRAVRSDRGQGPTGEDSGIITRRLSILS
jgi:hypothetical protein